MNEEIITLPQASVEYIGVHLTGKHRSHSTRLPQTPPNTRASQPRVKLLARKVMSKLLMSFDPVCTSVQLPSCVSNCHQLNTLYSILQYSHSLSLLKYCHNIYSISLQTIPFIQ